MMKTQRNLICMCSLKQELEKPRLIWLLLLMQCLQKKM